MPLSMQLSAVNGTRNQIFLQYHLYMRYLVSQSGQSIVMQSQLYGGQLQASFVYFIYKIRKTPHFCGGFLCLRYLFSRLEAAIVMPSANVRGAVAGIIRLPYSNRSNSLTCWNLLNGCQFTRTKIGLQDFFDIIFVSCVSFVHLIANPRIVISDCLNKRSQYLFYSTMFCSYG